MTDPIKDPADPNVNPGGDGDKNPTVPRSKYEETVGEAKAARARAQAAETKLAEIEAANKKAEDKKALERGEVQKVLEERERELAEEKAKTAKMNADRAEARKLHLFLKDIGGSLGEEFYPLIDLDKIKTDAEGNVDSASLKEYSDGFKTRYVAVIGKPGSATPPATKPEGMGGTVLGVEEWNGLPLKEKQAKLHEAHKQYVEKRRAK